jgi:hypothetical protein
MAEKPKHACQMVLTIEGHARQDIADVLLDFAVRVGNNEAGTEGFGAGPRGSYEYKLSISNTPTDREYHNQLRDWLAAEREARNSADVPAGVAVGEKEKP